MTCDTLTHMDEQGLPASTMWLQEVWVQPPHTWYSRAVELVPDERRRYARSDSFKVDEMPLSIETQELLAQEAADRWLNEINLVASDEWTLTDRTSPYGTQVFERTVRGIGII